MVETPEIKEMAMRAQKMKEVLLAEIKEFHERWKENVVELRQKHQQQQKDYLKHGPKKEAVHAGNEAFEMDEASPSPRASSTAAFVKDKEDEWEMKSLSSPCSLLLDGRIQCTLYILPFRLP